MAYANFETKEIHCKVLYCGPQGSGKTENLKSVYLRSSVRLRKESPQFQESRFAPFEFMPISLGRLKDFHVKLHLYTIPEHTLFPTFNMMLLRAIDGLVFVADSRLGCLQENIDSWIQTKDMLTIEGYNISSVPRVIQYNKRDHQEAVAIDSLRQELNPYGHQEVEAVATKHIGTMETILKVSSLILDEFGK